MPDRQGQGFAPVNGLPPWRRDPPDRRRSAQHELNLPLEPWPVSYRSLAEWDTDRHRITRRPSRPLTAQIAPAPVVAQGGDYFGRTVNLAARIAAHAGAGQVLVSGSLAESAPPQGMRFVEGGEVRLKGFAHPVRLLEACRA